MGVFGMDIEQGRNLSRELSRASERFARLSGQLTPLIVSSPWSGPDGESFRGDWKGHRQLLVATSNALREASNAVRENIRQQEDASSKDTEAGGGKSLLDRLKATAGSVATDLWDGAGTAVDTVRDKADDGWNWLRDHAPSPLRNLADAGGDALGGLGRMSWDFLLAGEPPSITELVARSTEMAAAGLNLNIALATGGILQPHILDDGSPVAGPPQPVGVGKADDINGHRSTPVPSSLSNIMGGVAAAYDDGGKSGTPDAAIRITTVDKGDGPAYIVSIPGTSEWNVRSGSNPLDSVGNLSSASGDMSTASQAVQLAMQQAGIPRDAPVMLVGHSQGGMTAAALAADPGFVGQFNVTNVMTYGSPIDSTPIPGSVNTLAMQHPFDVVPRLDLGNAKPGLLPIPWPGSNNASVVTLPAPAGVGLVDAAGSHDYNNYAASVSSNENSGALAAYKNDPSTQVFLTEYRGQVTSTVSNVGRER